MTFKKLKPITQGAAGSKSGCPNCGPQTITCDMNSKLTVGFGCVTVKRGRDILFSDDPDWDKAPTLMEYEKMAQEDPDKDWRVVFFAPLSETEFQRQGENNWVLVKKGPGFA